MTILIEGDKSFRFRPQVDYVAAWGLDVTAERLNAMPFTRLCCDCQQEREREARARRRYEEQDYEGYKLGSIHAQEESNHDPLMSPGNESFLELLQTESGHRD